MTDWARVLRAAIVSGTFASAASTAALAVAGRVEGKGALAPTNSTSHWLNGDRAAAFKGADLSHTAVGLLTHHAATVFWAVLFEAWNRRPGSAPAMSGEVDQGSACDSGWKAHAGRALAVSAVAATVDYTITPRRFTPGWELVLSKRAMAAVYVAMAFGMAAGGTLMRRSRHRQ